MLDLTSVVERHMNDIVVVCLEDVPPMVRHDVQVVTNRPAKHRRREQERSQRSQTPTVEYYDVGSPEWQTEPSKDAALHHIIHPTDVNGGWVGPTPEMPPDMTELPLSHQLQQRRDEVRAPPWLGRNDPESRL